MQFLPAFFPPFLPLLEEMGPSETKETLARGGAAPAASRCCACGRGEGFAAPAASRFSPGGEAASGGHISFCEERNVGKKVA